LLKEAAREDPDQDQTITLLTGFAAWDLEAGLKLAVEMNDADRVEEVLEEMVWGPFNDRLSDTSDYGFEVLKHSDLTMGSEAFRQGSKMALIMIMEGSGDLDVAETARFGLDFLLRTNYVPRAELLKFFSGEDIYADTGDVVDRTFCALRVWAAAHPTAMKAWIVTIQEADLRESLTWLLEHSREAGIKE